MANSNVFNDFKEQIDRIKIFDTHEHVQLETERNKNKLDFFVFFLNYASSDLISSGMSEEELELIKDTNIDISRRWKIFRPYWSNIENTMYAKILQIIAEDIFDVKRIDEKNIIKISDSMENNKEVAYYDQIIKERCNIEYILNDLDCIPFFANKGTDKDYVLPVSRPENILLFCSSMEDIYELERKYKRNIYKLSHFLEVIDEMFEKRKNSHYSLKIGAAYERPIFFEEVSFSEAEKDFCKILTINNYYSPDAVNHIYKDNLKKFQDFVFRYCIEKAIEYNKPIQIHTGPFEGNRSNIMNSNPALLTNLFMKYKKAKFDLFHIGYPYTDELINIVKMFPNCYMDMCWTPAYSKKLYKRALDLFVELIPSNKIFAFGGDYLFVEGIYASQKIAREAITEVLYERVVSGYFTLNKAVEFAEKILNKNPKRIYLC